MRIPTDYPNVDGFGRAEVCHCIIVETDKERALMGERMIPKFEPTVETFKICQQDTNISCLFPACALSQFCTIHGDPT